ncbi:MAG: REDY-like protein HapK [Woeseiaceae bacterium]
MTTIVVLFNLKTDADSEAYEQWAIQSDLKTVRGLSAIDRFDVLRTNGILGQESAPPYQYIEILEVNDMSTFGTEVATETMRGIAAQFREFADSPMFITCQSIEA